MKEKIAAGEDRGKCVGSIADACLDKSEDPSTYGMANCSRREQEVWDERLNAAYKELMSEVDRKQRISVRDMQRSWIAFRDKKCGLHSVLEEGSIVIPIIAYCYMEETGRQAVFLEQLVSEGDSR